MKFSSLRRGSFAFTGVILFGVASCGSTSGPSHPDGSSDGATDGSADGATDGLADAAIDGVPDGSVGLDGPGADSGADAADGGVAASIPCVDGGAGVVVTTTTAPATPANIVLDGTTLYFTTVSDGSGATGIPDSVMTVPVTGGAPTMLASGKNTPSFSGATYIAVAGGNLYWAANSTVFPGPANVYTTPLAGGTQVAINAGAQAGMIVSGGNVYFGQTPNLDVITPPSTTPTVLTTAFYSLDDLAFDGATFYWHDGRDGMPDNITKVPLAGGTPTILVNNAGNRGDYTDFVADATTLYWGAALADQSAAVKSLPVGGGTPTVFEAPLPFYTDALGLDDTNVYIAAGGFLWKKAKTGAGPLTCLAVTKTGSGANLVVDATYVYWPDQETGRIMKVAK
jgi:hypothetical protein